MKPIEQSKTVWVNSILSFIGIIGLATPLVNDLFTPEAAVKILSVLLFLGGTATVILRVWFTSQPIGNEE